MTGDAGYGALRFGSRAPVSVLVERQRKKLAGIEERLHRLMSVRSLEEEKLADLIRRQQRLDQKESRK